VPSRGRTPSIAVRGPGWPCAARPIIHGRTATVGRAQEALVRARVRCSPTRSRGPRPERALRSASDPAGACFGTILLRDRGCKVRDAALTPHSRGPTERHVASRFETRRHLDYTGRPGCAATARRGRRGRDQDRRVGRRPRGLRTFLDGTAEVHVDECPPAASTIRAAAAIESVSETQDGSTAG